MAEDAVFEKAKQRAFRLLAARTRSEREIRLKLREGRYDSDVIEGVVTRLLEMRYLDDEVFARQWARNLAVNRLFGDIRIGISLREKGIPEPLSRLAIAEARVEVSEAQAIGQLMKKKARNSGKLDRSGGEKRRLAQYLMSKGFSPRLVFDMLDRSEEGCVYVDGQ
jgi:regulatory protein